MTRERPFEQEGTLMSVDETIEVNGRKRLVKAVDADLSGSSFMDVNLSGATFKNVPNLK